MAGSRLRLKLVPNHCLNVSWAQIDWLCTSPLDPCLSLLRHAPPPAIDDLAVLPDLAVSVARRLAEHVDQIDRALCGIDELLNLLQPPKTGKARP